MLMLILWFESSHARWLVCLLTMSHILRSVKAEIWGRGFYSGSSMNVRFLSGVVVLVVEQSTCVGRRTMLTHLLFCSLAERLLPTRRQRALTPRLQQHPHAQRITEMTVRKELCESERSCQEGFISFSNKNHMNPVKVKAVSIFCKITSC